MCADDERQKSNNYIYERIRRLIKSTKIKCTVLIDLGPLQFEADEHYTYLLELVQICYAVFTHHMCSTVVALSSGSGRLIEFPKSCQEVLQKFMVSLNSYPQCHFKAFNEEEALVYIKKKGLDLNTVDAKRLTNYNPWLLSTIPCEKVKLSLVDSFIVTCVLRHVKNLLDSFKKIELNNWIASELETTIFWFYKAANMIPLTEHDIDRFNHSWVHTEYICDLDASDDSTFLTFNFPHICRLLLDELSTLRKTEAIPSNPIINGYIFERSFFDEINKCNALRVYCNGAVLHLKVGCVRYMNNNECVDNMTVGVLYYLRYKHPVIDGVLKVGGKKKRLILLQISLSKYDKHGSKIGDLQRQIKCLEANSRNENILNYYQRLAGISNKYTIYLYVAPDEIGENAKALKKGRKDAEKSGIQVGVVASKTPTHDLIDKINSNL